MPTILLIEDNPEIRESMAEILELSGYNILKAHNGKEGVTIARENKPDLIICDVMMPELDGFGVISLLSKDPETQQIPFIFLTSKIAAQDLRKGMNLGADDYLTKPFELSELLQAIEVRLQKAYKRAPAESIEKENHPSGSAQKGKQTFASWVQKFEERIFQNNQIIFESGSSPVFFYWLTEGIVQLTHEPSPGRVFIRTLKRPTGIIGLAAYVNNAPQFETAICMTDVKVRLIPSADFDAFMQEKPSVMRYFLSELAHEVQQQQLQQSNYAFASVRKRVALSLARLHQVFPDQEIDLPREILANFAAVSRGGLMRVLAEFREDGFIETDNSKLKILDPQSLSQISD